MAEPIEMSFGLWTLILALMGHRTHYSLYFAVTVALSRLLLDTSMNIINCILEYNMRA